MAIKTMTTTMITKQAAKRSAITLSFVLALPVAALAQGGAQQQTQQQTQQPGSAAQQAQSLRESTVRGTVRSVEPEGKMQLDVRGQSLTVEGTERQVKGYNPGDEVQATVVPLAQAKSVKPLEEASVDEQTAANEPLNNVIVGLVLDVQQDVALLDVPGEGQRRVKLSSGSGNDIVLGQNYVVTLEAPTEVTEYQLRDIRKR